MKKEKNKKVYASSRTALAVLAVASLIAFCLSAFVSTDVVTNTFKASTLDIALIEENYDKLTEKQRFSLIPNRRLDKDPKIKNTDNTDAFVFLKVTVPVAEVTEKDIRSQTSSDYSFTQLYSYTGNVQSFTVSQTGYYKLEAWGAQGGSAAHSISDDKTDVSSQIDGGKGGYSCGTVYLEKDQTIYICVGEQGKSITASTENSGEIVNGGYNGGGNALVVSDSQYYYLGSGGGATHFAFSSGTLSNLSENKNSV
ncbi:MAG: glycine rich domain-containing protein, partial [Acutalibacteraceae bacterium]|nr:glycine rich domain-containing protein [Acutalibacteraceae bacterium]